MPEFEWDDYNTGHIARHGLSQDETEDAVEDPNRVAFSAHGGKVGFIGKTSGGRVLVVILQRKSAGVWRPVTARDAGPNEKKSYRRRTR